MNSMQTTEDIRNYASEACAEVDEQVRQHPGSSILIALGVGLALGIIVRSLSEPKPVHPAMRALNDLEERIRDLAGPLTRKASSLASECADAVQESVHQGEAFFDKGWRRLRGLFS